MTSAMIGRVYTWDAKTWLVILRWRAPLVTEPATLRAACCGHVVFVRDSTPAGWTRAHQDAGDWSMGWDTTAGRAGRCGPRTAMLGMR